MAGIRVTNAERGSPMAAARTSPLDGSARKGFLRGFSLRFVGPAVVAVLVATAFAPRMAAGQAPDAAPRGAQYPGVASLYVSPAASVLLLGGDEVVLEERVAGIPFDPGLGSFALQIDFNPNLVSMVIEEGAFLGSTGRSTSCGYTAVTETFVLYDCASSGSQRGA